MDSNFFLLGSFWFISGAALHFKHGLWLSHRDSPSSPAGGPRFMLSPTCEGVRPWYHPEGSGPVSPVSRVLLGSFPRRRLHCVKSLWVSHWKRRPAQTRERSWELWSKGTQQRVTQRQFMSFIVIMMNHEGQVQPESNI